MAYRLKRHESIAGAYRRIVSEQFEVLLRESKAAGGHGIHEARKRCKAVRALIKLLEGAFEARACRRADEALKKIARALAPVRDAEARLQTLEELIARAGLRASHRHAHVRSLLHAQAASARRLSLTAADLRDVAALTSAAQARLLALEPGRKGWRALAPGITGSYRRGRRSCAEAREDPSPDVRHRWRKRVKMLWYHLRLLQSCQPKKLGVLAQKLRTLSETLGAEHDLALLRQHLAQHGKRNRSPAAFDGIVALIDARRTQLRRVADTLGRALYAQKPAEFSARLKRAWDRWRE